jgi:hypothetical protein
MRTGFGRHREQQHQPPVIEKVEEKPVEVELKVEKISEEKIKELEDALQPKIKIVRENRERKTKPVKAQPVPKDFIIEDPAKIEEKEGIESKKYVNIALNGTTVVCNDFRAICKKKGLRITDVLNKIIGKWNAENYNF